MEANSEKVERATAEVAIQEKEEGEYILENKNEGLGEQCHLVKEEFVKLRGESSDCSLKIFRESVFHQVKPLLFRPTPL